MTWDSTDEAPRAEVTQVGRWTYSVVIVHGIMQYGPDGSCWLVLGRRRAWRKARRALARYLRDQARRSAVAHFPDDPREPA